MIPWKNQEDKQHYIKAKKKCQMKSDADKDVRVCPFKL